MRPCMLCVHSESIIVKIVDPFVFYLYSDLQHADRNKYNNKTVPQRLHHETQRSYKEKVDQIFKGEVILTKGGKVR